MRPVLQVGDLVRWENPVDEREARERFVVREANGDRTIVMALGSGMRIRPTFTYATDQLRVVAAAAEITPELFSEWQWALL